MHWLTLPEAPGAAAPAFQTLEEASSWLAGQKQDRPSTLLAEITGQIRALDGAGLPPPLCIELLDLLRRTAMPLHSAEEALYTRKALPLSGDAQQVFDAASGFWTTLGIAYFRLACALTPTDKCLPLHRAANAFRMAQYAYFQASRVCPTQLDQLIFAVLAESESSGQLRQALLDPEFPHLGDANISGLLAWAFLLRLIDPYRLSLPQLLVANRALSRWRELCTFQAAPDSDPKAHPVDLATLFGGPLPEGIPRWLNVRSVIRKVHTRIESLQAGETPEALKLGRELSAAASIRLLDDIEHALRSPSPQVQQTSRPGGEMALAFGAEYAYSVLTGQLLNPRSAMDAKSSALAHQRMALFGFDSQSQMPNAVRRVEVPTETWLPSGDQAFRPEAEGPRLQAPCLIATVVGGAPRLGTLSRLLSHPDGKLSATLNWFAERIECCSLKQLAPASQGMPKVPAFLLFGKNENSLIVPINAGVRPEFGLVLNGASIEHLVPTTVLERGVDFVRYAYRRS